MLSYYDDFLLEMAQCQSLFSVASTHFLLYSSSHPPAHTYSYASTIQIDICDIFWFHLKGSESSEFGNLFFITNGLHCFGCVKVLHFQSYSITTIFFWKFIFNLNIFYLFLNVYYRLSNTLRYDHFIYRWWILPCFTIYWCSKANFTSN